MSKEKHPKCEPPARERYSARKVAPASFGDFLNWLDRDPKTTTKYGEHDLGGATGIWVDHDYRILTVKGVSVILMDDAGFTKLEHVKRELFKSFPEDAFDFQVKGNHYAIILKGQT